MAFPKNEKSFSMVVDNPVKLYRFDAR